MTKKLTKKQLIKVLKPFWQMAKNADKEYYRSLEEIEKVMRKETGIKDLEIFLCDGLAGIGNESRTMDLIDFEELE